jgi:hypothetical protein
MDWDGMDVGCPCYKNGYVEFVYMVCGKTKDGIVDWASKDKKKASDTGRDGWIYDWGMGRQISWCWEKVGPGVWEE